MQRHFLSGIRRLSTVPQIGVTTSAARFAEHGGARADVPPPLAVFCGWMGAKESQMRRYLSLWHERGCDTLSYAVGPQHVLMPTKGQAHMAELMGSVRDDIVARGPRPVIFHHMSVGGYLFGQMLRNLKEDGAFEPGAEDPLLDCVTAQIFDSPPDVHSIADGIPRSMGMGPLGVSLLPGVVSTYLRATRDGAGVHHRAASDAFHENLVRAPSPWHYSHADNASQSADPQPLTRLCRAGRTDVTEVVWDDTPHSQHYRMDPARRSAPPAARCPSAPARPPAAARAGTSGSSTPSCSAPTRSRCPRPPRRGARRRRTSGKRWRRRRDVKRARVHAPMSHGTQKKNRTS